MTPPDTAPAQVKIASQMGERIARLRRNKGWKQKALASRIGCSLQQLSKLERGRWMPRASMILCIGETFEVTADYLLTGREPQHPHIDQRLRDRLPALDGLPKPQRDALVDFLDALIMAHRYAALNMGEQQPHLGVSGSFPGLP